MQVNVFKNQSQLLPYLLFELRLYKPLLSLSFLIVIQSELIHFSIFIQYSALVGTSFLSHLSKTEQ